MHPEKRIRATGRPWASLIVLGLLVIGVTGCQALRGDTSCEDNPAADWRVVLPPSAGQVEERCAMNLVNPSYTATFTLSPADLEAFQASIVITEWQTEASEALVFADEAARMESLRLGRYMDGVVALEVLIDTSDPQAYRVFYDAAYVD